MMSFAAFAQGYGLILNHPIADGNWHSCPTIRKPKRKQGRYHWDGKSGVVGDFSSGEWHAYHNGSDEVTPDVRKIANEARQSEAKRHAEARKLAVALMDECVQGTHAYLARKGFPRLTGFVHTSGDLLIPMRDIQDYNMVNGVQRISPDGTKKFMLGMKAKGSVFRIGSKGPTWIVEGFCTGKSVELAMRHLYQTAQIVVAFSAGNLQYVSQFVKRPAFVFADADDAGTNAAMATNLPWTVSDALGEDCNDLHLRAGVRAVSDLIREAQDQAAGY
jgi:phage/plasmid primase-like uncharacterized protein